MKHSVQFFKNIDGIGAASGIVFVNDLLYIIADNSEFLYLFNIGKNTLEKINLKKNSQESIPKKNKLDLESITRKGNKLHIFGSGSTKKRELKFTFNLKTNEVRTKKLDKRYVKLKQNTQFDSNELNIEGAFYDSKNLYLIQRGNGKENKNGVFKIDENKQINFSTINLPSINNILSTFTDAILVKDKIYFLAAVEDTNSTYDDGEILGSFIGRMSLNFEIDFVMQISEFQKFEGLSLYESGTSEMSFLLCEDNDKEELNTKIYLLKIEM